METTSATTTYLWVRHATAEKAIASATRLGAKYGPRFAVTTDPTVATHPFVVVSNPATPDVVMGPRR